MIKMPPKKKHSGDSSTPTEDWRVDDNQPSPSTAKKKFQEINNRQVDDIQLEFFYKPHTISCLLACLALLIYMAFSRDTSDYRSNVWAGLGSMFIYFMVISILAFPNGPFTRPHPILWRMVFGCSVLYLMMIQIMIHQDYKTVRDVIVWLDPKMENYTIDTEKEYGVDCWDITWERIWSHFDWFAFGHYFGWGMKALLIRHYGICWSISIMWELTEMAFGHLLPNFYECWWDNIVLDVFLCNGMGIFTGMLIVRWLEMREHHWESIKNISTKSGKLKRALLQFTPESLAPTRWLDPGCSWMRFVAIFQLVLIFQVVELNNFFVKHIFPMPAEHPILVFRILINGLMGAPAARQYYTYVTDRRCKRLGSQVWVFIFISLSELVLNLKFGQELFSQTEMSKILIWLMLNVLIAVAGTYVSMKIYNWRFPPPPQTPVTEHPHSDKIGEEHHNTESQTSGRLKSD